MTFLELVNAARREAGGSAGQPPLVSVGGSLSYENTRFVNWVRDAWRDIQSLHRTWQFMEREVSFETAAGQQVYEAASLAPTPLTSFANWKIDSYRAYKTATGFSDEQILPFCDYGRFRDLYLFGAMRTTQQRPVMFSIDPRKRFVLGAVPDDAYTINGWYYKAPQILTGDTDVPEIDEEFHDLIVWYAIRKYGFYEAAPDVLERAREEEGKLMSALESDYLPTVVSGPPLA